MENEELEVDFHSTLEPDVIIDDNSNNDQFYGTSECNRHQTQSTHIGQSQLGPEISLIPVKASTIRVKMFDSAFRKSVSSTALQHKIPRVIHRTPRQTVRLISKEELLQVGNCNSISKRKSLPLEKCPICKKYFRRMKTHLQKHENISRDLNDPLTCRFCMKIFNTGSNLSIHMRTHTGDKPYRCEVCTKGFAQSCNLVNHMRIHTGERPFKCPHCDRAFTQSGNLNNHVRLHTDEKPFKCHFCDKAFTQSGNLNSHIRNNHKFIDNVPSNIAGELNPLIQ